MLRNIGNLLWRFRPRFGLRALLLAVTLLCLWLGHVVERWRAEVAALRELYDAEGLRGQLVQDWWGEQRRIVEADELSFADSVVEIKTLAGFDGDLTKILLSFPRLRLLQTYQKPTTASDYRFLTRLQRQHPAVDIRYPSIRPARAWVEDVSKLSEFEQAKMEFYQTKGWQYFHPSTIPTKHVAER